jgi:hypothetical protein
METINMVELTIDEIDSIYGGCRNYDIAMSLVIRVIGVGLLAWTAGYVFDMEVVKSISSIIIVGGLGVFCIVYGNSHYRKGTVNRKIVIKL